MINFVEILNKRDFLLIIDALEHTKEYKMEKADDIKEEVYTKAIYNILIERIKKNMEVTK